MEKFSRSTQMQQSQQLLIRICFQDTSIIARILLKDGNPIIFPDLPQRRLNEDAIDYDLLEDLVHYIDETHPEGAILVFLPRVSEIHTLFDKLAASYQFGGRSSEWLLPLHSSSVTDRKRCFYDLPIIYARGVVHVLVQCGDVEFEKKIDEKIDQFIDRVEKHSSKKIDEKIGQF
ncbi:hypothetical protein LOK49_LG15G00584 [Camellia lanceoleosa]|uniref:Uncharacterized protein n=1 Tax=Camellia lanceoleosa TaxID=1840588 RepID=A0ACC0F3X9_9ERIC|nr:hypothetical protein LOK49_LG15G00584 [Camellia lanceoleosa]